MRASGTCSPGSAVFKKIIIALTAGWMMTGNAHALSSACQLVNSGTYDRSSPNSFIESLGSGYDPGEIVSFTVSSVEVGGQGGIFRIMIDAVEVLLVIISSTPTTYSQTMTSPSEDLSVRYQGTGGRFFNGMTVRCMGNEPGASQSYDRAVTKSFLLSRINGLLLNSPASTSLLYRQLGPQGAHGAAAASDALAPGADAAMAHAASRFDDVPDTGSRPVWFKSSLSSMRSAAREGQMQRDRMALGAGEGGTLPLAFEGDSAWDVWIEGRYSGFDDDAGNLGRNGHVGLLFLGSDYRITPDIIVGGLVQWDRSNDAFDALTTEISGTGWMIGPYVSARLHENIYADLRAAWGSSWNDLDAGATNASFDTSRWLVKGTLSGNWIWDAWRLTPSAELAYVEESQDAFTNSAGALVAGQDVSLGRLQFGPEIGYRFAHTPQLLIEPFAAIKGVWDFDNPNVQIIDGIIAGPGDFWGRLEGGLNVLSTDGLVVRGLASWDGVGSSDYSGYTLQGIVNVPLN